MGTPVPRQSPRSPPRGNPLSGPQVKLASFSPSLAAETRPRLGSSAGGGRPGPAWGAEPGVAWGAEPGRLLSPALIPPAPAPRQLQREGKEGRGLRVSAGAGPQPAGPAAAERVFSRRSGVSLALVLRVLYRTPSLPESRSGLPSKAEASSGSAGKLFFLSELQTQERSAAVNRGGQGGALDGELRLHLAAGHCAGFGAVCFGDCHPKAACNTVAAS